MRLTGHLICRGTLTIINKKGHLQMQVTLVRRKGLEPPTF